MVKSGCGSLKSRSKKLYAAFLEDVELVARHSLDEESHHALLELFFLKWEAVETSLEVKTALDSALNYFRKNWVNDSSVCHWYQGSSPLQAMTNNGLERHNAVIKSESYCNGQKHALNDLYHKVRIFYFCHECSHFRR